MKGEVFVDAGEFLDVDGGAGFLADFAAEAVGDGLVEFEDAAGWFPAVVVASLDEEHVVGVDHDAGDAD